jgi:hypothetical protein
MIRNSRNPSLGLYGVAIVCSVLLSLDGFLRASVINPDGICYLQSASTFVNAGLHAAMSVCGQAAWPFYSVLIGVFSSALHVSVINAAFILNAIFSCITVISFIYLVTSLSPHSKTLAVFAALTILLAHEFNAVREYVIRDHGFWAFYTLSMIGLLHYLRHLQWRYALLWAFSLVIATLFRVEGVVFLILLPFLGLLTQKPLRAFLELNTFNVLGAVALLAYDAMHPDFLSHNRLQEIFYQFTHGAVDLKNHVLQAADHLREHVINHFAASDALGLLVTLLVVWFLSSVLANLSLVYAALAFYALLKKHIRLDKPAVLVLCGYILVNVCITATFLANYLFLSKRYLIALSLVLMVLVPFALESLWQQKQKPWLIGALIAMSLAGLGGIVEFGYSKAYLREAGLWLKTHTDKNTTLYSNNEQVLFYSEHFGNQIFAAAKNFSDPKILTAGQWKHYASIALVTKAHDENDVMHELLIQAKPTQVFANKRGDKVMIWTFNEGVAR